MCPAVGRTQISLSQEGLANSRIVIDTANPIDSTAAALLQRFVAEMSGARLPITDYRTAGNHLANDVLIGDFQRSNWRQPPSLLDSLVPDGFLIDSRENYLRILSGGDKGSIYGVVSLLDDVLGMNYYAKDTYTLKKQASIQIAAMLWEDHPAFTYRQTTGYFQEDPICSLWFRVERPAEVFANNLWVHTFDKLLPSEVFGQSHPEYYSLIKGKRQPGKASQWCLTNKEVLERVGNTLDSIFQANPEQDIVSVSQNDGNFTYCSCDACKAIDQQEASPSGSLIHFVNQLADRFPDKTISTLAYLYSMKPPRYIKPRPNVNIMLCSIDAMREVPLSDNPSGQVFVEALKGWAAISDNIFVWDYGINFDNLVSPFPNFHILQPNMALFKQQHVKMHFAQVGGKRGEDFSELRAYMLTRLLWNPEQNPDELMQEFMQGYYGPAAPYLYQYQHMLEAALLSNNIPLWIYDSPVSHKAGMLRPRLMKRYQQLFDQAEAAVADQADLLDRVQRSRLPLQYAELEIARTEATRDTAHLLVLLDTFQARTNRFDVYTLNERNNSPSDYCRLYRSRYLKKPKGNLAYQAAVSWLEAPSPRYLEAGETALTDQLYGGTTFAESWIGWEGKDGAFILDLGEVKDVRSVETDFLHQLGAWILLPRSVAYSSSIDGRNFSPLGKQVLEEDRSREVKFVGVKVEKEKAVAARYIQIAIEGVKVCPSWHYGVGYPAWFFIDEVVVR